MEKHYKKFSDMCVCVCLCVDVGRLCVVNIFFSFHFFLTI